MKTIAIVAQDKLKSEVVTWCENNRNTLKNCKLVGTAGTAALIYDTTSLSISSLKHGPSGGDIQIASHIIEGNIDMSYFNISARKSIAAMFTLISEPMTLSNSYSVLGTIIMPP